jgi:hypothetical protein
MRQIYVLLVGVLACNGSNASHDPDASAPDDATDDAADVQAEACANLETDPNNCGACGHVCSSVHGTAACVGGSCTLACTGTFDDCDANPANGCETDTAKSATSCGKCGHDCQGGSCKGGICQPLVLATGQFGAGAIAVDGTNVYWVIYDNNDSEIRACSKTGCNMQPTTLAANQATNSVQPASLVTDGTNLYWPKYADNSIQKCAGAGCGMTPTALVSGQTGLSGVTLDATYVYFGTTLSGGEVRKCALAGCGNSPTTVTASPNPGAIAVDANHMYWEAGVFANSKGIFQCDLPTCATQLTIGSSSQGTAIAVDAKNIF